MLKRELTVENLEEFSSFFQVLLVEAGEQGTSGQVTSAGEPRIPLLDWQLLPGQGSQLLEQGQDAVRLLLDGHLDSTLETALKTISV